MKKKDYIIVSVFTALFIFGISVIYVLVPPEPDPTTLIRGSTDYPHNFEPLDALDAESYTFLHQTCEGLYAFNHSDPKKGIIPNLAEDLGIWNNNVTLTVNLRQDVIFHDGTQFNADAVKFTFDKVLKIH